MEKTYPLCPTCNTKTPSSTLSSTAQTLKKPEMNLTFWTKEATIGPF